jgi:hypothetical protein
VDLIVVEGPTVEPTGPGPQVLVVEVDRVVLGVSSANSARLVVITDGAASIRPWVAQCLPELDAEQRRAGRELVTRTEDRSGTPFTATSPWHVSTYRGVSASPPCA